jgi:hypothetical protein
MKRKLVAASKPETFLARTKWFTRWEAAINVFFQTSVAFCCQTCALMNEYTGHYISER